MFIEGDLAALSERLRDTWPDLVLVVVGTAEEQSNVASQITSGVVYRFLHRPVSAPRVRLFVDAALRRHEVENVERTLDSCARISRASKQPKAAGGSRARMGSRGRGPRRAGARRHRRGSRVFYSRAPRSPDGATSTAEVVSAAAPKPAPEAAPAVARPTSAVIAPARPWPNAPAPVQQPAATSALATHRLAGAIANTPARTP